MRTLMMAGAAVAAVVYPKLPKLAQAHLRRSMIVIDPKGQLAAITARAKESTK
jgi:hypothetical protein